MHKPSDVTLIPQPNQRTSSQRKGAAMPHKQPDFLSYSPSPTADYERRALARLYEWLLELSRASDETASASGGTA